MSSYQRVKYENDLNGECIMLMREHLASVGIATTFADDVAAIAAYQIRLLRADLERCREIALSLSIGKQP